MLILLHLNLVVKDWNDCSFGVNLVYPVSDLLGAVDFDFECGILI
ncbi:hypothetical protein Hanom_Chr14g01278411 [Helianthus anomalus]